jgi:hypothetical protein
MINPFKTRKGKLEHKIKLELNSKKPNIDKILLAIDEYQKDNENTIDKLKKGKKIEVNRINGALKQSINAHGPITKELIGSASKRIHGALLSNPNEDENKKVSIRDVMIGLTIGISISFICLIVF